MRLFNKYLLLLSTICALVLFSSSVIAASVDDVRILIDVSGSMQKTDPNNLRAPALRMINGLLPKNSNAGVWTFGRYVNEEVKWGKVNNKWRSAADAGAARIHSRGLFTNIESAIKYASKGWDIADPKTQRNLILLTDGKVDISKKKAKNDQSRESILNQLLPELIKNKVKVHAIGLSSETDEVLLKRLALKTSGSFEIATTATDLQRVFLRMFQRAIKPDTVPLKGNKFTVDRSIKEMTLLVFKTGKTDTHLIQPDKKAHIHQKYGSNIKWRSEKGYDLITVSKPLHGTWTIEADMDPDNRVMIVTDLKLFVEDIPPYMTPDKAINLHVELHNSDKKISKNSFLKFVNFEISHTADGDKKTEPLKKIKSRQVKDKGVFLHTYDAPLAEGQHEIIVNSNARTFSRSKRLMIEVQWPIDVKIIKAAKPGQYNLWIKAREEYIKPDSLNLEVNLKTPSGKVTPIEVKSISDEWSGSLVANEEDGLHSLLVTMQAETIEGETIKHDLDPYSVLGAKLESVENKSEQGSESEESQDNAAKSSDEKPEIEVVTESEDGESNDDEDSSDLMMTIIIISVTNVVLIIIGMAAFLYFRKKKKEGLVSLVDEEVPPDEKLKGGGND